MTYRIFVEKKKSFANEAKSLFDDAKKFLKIESLTDVRIINRYDVDDITEELFEYSVKTVFSEPQLDNTFYELDTEDAEVFTVEFLPGQFNQRADSAEQCIQIISQGKRPNVNSAKVYMLYGDLTEEDVNKIKKYVINPIEARETDLEKTGLSKVKYQISNKVEILRRFCDYNNKKLLKLISVHGLSMDLDDMKYCQAYFKLEERDPTITEIKIIDSYWSENLRHTTFLTMIDDVKFEDEILNKSYQKYLDLRDELGITKPVCLMDVAGIVMKEMKRKGELDEVRTSKGVSSCTVEMEIEVDGKKEPWLILFKNEAKSTYVEKAPFDGAETSAQSVLKDPLSGRGYVYATMRVTGAADPTATIEDTLEGKLPQRKIVIEAADGYSAYGNQVGLATGLADEIYHEGYLAERMEIGVAIAATSRENIRNDEPVAGDVILLLGNKTGRDGIDVSTNLNEEEISEFGAQVQKSNASEERKMQRFFRNNDAVSMIKRGSDIGIGGISVALGRLADGMEIDLNALPKKYDDLDGTELAISETEARMAVVIEQKNLDDFLRFAADENLDATKFATVTGDKRITMYWKGSKIVDVSKKFLNSNGATKHTSVEVEKIKDYNKTIEGGFVSNLKGIASDLNICSKRGLSERFDSTIGAGTVLMPFGGKNQRTPIQAMVQKINVEKKDTSDCSVMSWGFNPFISEKSPFHAGYIAVVESICKLIATGAEFDDIYLSFQEFFEELGNDSKRWGRAFAIILGAFEAQERLGVASIGGNDSVGASFENLDVPPTLVSFALTTQKIDNIISPEFKTAGNKVVYIPCPYDENDLPDADRLVDNFRLISTLMLSGKVKSCYTLGMGGIAEAVMKMCMGNGFGFDFNNADLGIQDIFGYGYGGFVLEVSEDVDEGQMVGRITNDAKFTYGKEAITTAEINEIYEDRLEEVYACNINKDVKSYEKFSYESKSYNSASIKTAKPNVIIPAFPGTNCEFDSAKAMLDAGANPKILVIRNLEPSDIQLSIEKFAKRLKNAQMVFIPGGFSGADEPDGSGKFITAFFRNQIIKEGIEDMLDRRGGLMCGICNGFQALIKLGLVPYGKIMDTDENSPTLTFNTIARHQSKIIRTRIASNKSPWLSLTNVGDIYSMPISHGEGKFVCSEELIKQLAQNGQIATQYVDFDGNASNDVNFTPSDSMYAVEGLTSPDGRVFGKMGHCERKGYGLYKNVPGNYDIRMFEAAVKFFK